MARLAGQVGVDRAVELLLIQEKMVVSEYEPYVLFKRHPLHRPWLAGYQAGYGDEGSCRNPYPVGTPEARVWQEGWDMGQSQRRKEDSWFRFPSRTG